MTKESRNYEDVILSESTAKGMSLNIDDQVFLKRILDRQDEVTQQYISETYQLHAGLIIDTVREMLNEQNEKIFIRFDALETRMSAIETSIDDITKTVDITKKEVDDLKRVTSPIYYFIRIIIGVATGIGFVRWLHGPF